jgi:hypothetical protein
MSGYPPGTRVRLLTKYELFAGEVGTVMRTFLDDDGELVHVVRFRPDEPDWPHNTNYHFTDELVSAEVGGKSMKLAPEQGD